MSVARPARVHRIEARESEAGLVLCHATSGVHHLNSSASVIFELCDGTHTVDRIAELVRSAWDLEEPPLEAVLECLARFRAAALVI